MPLEILGQRELDTASKDQEEVFRKEGDCLRTCTV